MGGLRVILAVDSVRGVTMQYWGQTFAGAVHPLAPRGLPKQTPKARKTHVWNRKQLPLKTAEGALKTPLASSWVLLSLVAHVTPPSPILYW